MFFFPSQGSIEVINQTTKTKFKADLVDEIETERLIIRSGLVGQNINLVLKCNDLSVAEANNKLEVMDKSYRVIRIGKKYNKYQLGFRKDYNNMSGEVVVFLQ